MRKWLTLILSAMLVVALTACGSKDDAKEPADSDAPASQEVKLVATNFNFDQEEYKVAKGTTVKFTLENEKGTHGVQIKDLGVKLSGGKLSQTVTLDKPGTYEIACSIPCGAGHTKMKSKLVVE